MGPTLPGHCVPVNLNATRVTESLDLSSAGENFEAPPQVSCASALLSVGIWVPALSGRCLLEYIIGTQRLLT